jgi:hypothetical protein
VSVCHRSTPAGRGQRFETRSCEELLSPQKTLQIGPRRPRVGGGVQRSVRVARFPRRIGRIGRRGRCQCVARRTGGRLRDARGVGTLGATVCRVAERSGAARQGRLRRRAGRARMLRAPEGARKDAGGAGDAGLSVRRRSWLALIGNALLEVGGTSQAGQRRRTMDHQRPRCRLPADLRAHRRGCAHCADVT